MRWKELAYLFIRALSLICGLMILLFLYPRYSLSFIFWIIMIGYVLFDYHIVGKTLKRILVPSTEARAASQTCYELFVGSDLWQYWGYIRKQKESPNYKESISKFIICTIIFWVILLVGISLLIFLNFRYRIWSPGY